MKRYGLLMLPFLAFLVGVAWSGEKPGLDPADEVVRNAPPAKVFPEHKGPPQPAMKPVDLPESDTKKELTKKAYKDAPPPPMATADRTLEEKQKRPDFAALMEEKRALKEYRELERKAKSQSEDVPALTPAQVEEGKKKEAAFVRLFEANRRQLESMPPMEREEAYQQLKRSVFESN